ncbi:MAG: superoxide dismutase [Candidatus Thermoplasmatota archaeon]|jgi:Fe-Mn family superoxide dismutase|uniref:Superoxide dismutase n=1 Tax=Cuniculiplasma divulgatum TaxID=1673428 RepID=A0A1R4A4P4_9ARCH|nr:superoxide dismutase [Cuniculiplasma divulgatum]MCI2412989.1 superoxide dismutase [Cuniculiplasma sp.]MCL4320863.1 superoxide dismutase [Candidatus Thermoplasmatota archaeon]WMT50155.1 MAG: Fe-Mn family superoxide dismutase [Thermoplasmatales archaeon]MCL6014644.1 superoxide dismutase [Candidatus Thermoplasmatota archaeon]SJK83934.1 superoxide dismutase [Cuniculiplasma divulgatum]
MVEKWEKKNQFKPKGLDGISDQQIEYHFETHYNGYVTKLNEIWEKLPNADRSKANQNYSEFRELKLEETFNYDGSLLHEIYFESLKKDGLKNLSEELKKKISEDFGSYEKWVEDFKATGTAFRGWALLVYDLNTGKLRNIGADVHNTNGIWNAIVVMALDVYEHAYYVDYGAKRAPYLDAFMKNVDWASVNKRFEKAHKAYLAFK